MQHSFINFIQFKAHFTPTYIEHIPDSSEQTSVSMTSLYNHLYTVISQEAVIQLPPPVPGVQARQADSAADQTQLQQTSLGIVLALLAVITFYVTTLHLHFAQHRLENHAMCGITTGGQVGGILGIAFFKAFSIISGRMLFRLRD